MEVKMKSIIFSILLGGILCLAHAQPEVGILAQSESIVKERDEYQFKAVLRPIKPSYFPGEIVTLVLKIENIGKQQVTVSRAFRDASDSSVFYISRESGEFLMYVRSRFRTGGALDNLAMRPGESFESPMHILWNEKPEVEGLSAQTVAYKQKGKILDYYGFTEPGTYNVRTISNIVIWNNREPVSVSVESAPTQISIERPEGEDAQVWERIKRNHLISLFVQEGRFLMTKRGQQESLIREMDEIVRLYPNSILSKQIDDRLKEWRAKIEKWKEEERKRLERIKKEN